jgi:hypothetical protein
MRIAAVSYKLSHPALSSLPRFHLLGRICRQPLTERFVSASTARVAAVSEGDLQPRSTAHPDAQSLR